MTTPKRSGFRRPTPGPIEVVSPLPHVAPAPPPEDLPALKRPSGTTTREVRELETEPP